MADNHPINGRVGWFLSVVRQVTPLSLVLIGLFIALGFNYTTPAEAIKDTKERLERVERMLESLVRLECARVSDRDARLSDLNCTSVRRMRQ
jgi:uncharacterized membrane protein YgaE (UPF0421/DUF939 family)